MKPLIIGLGKAGCRVAEHFRKYNPILIDTDAENLKIRKSRNKILIGKEITGGKGTLRNYNYSLKALNYSLQKIFDKIRREYDFCFLICSFGGTGASGYYLGEKIKEEYDMKTYAFLITPSEEDDPGVKINFNKTFSKFLDVFDATFLFNNDTFKKENLLFSLDEINLKIFEMLNALFEISERDECIKINLYDIINSLKDITIIGYNYKKLKFKPFGKEIYTTNDFMELLRGLKFSYNMDLNIAKSLTIISKYDKRYIKDFSPSILTKLFLEKIYDIKNVRYGEVLNKKRKIEQILIFSEIKELEVKVKTFDEKRDIDKLYNILKNVLNDINKVQNTLKNLLI